MPTQPTGQKVGWLRRPVVRKPSAMLVALGFAAAGGLLALFPGVWRDASENGFAFAAALVALTYEVTLWVHEGGHWIAARLNGWPTLAFRAGCFDYDGRRSPRRWSVRLWKPGQSWVKTRVTSARGLTRRYLAFAAGGASANVLVALAVAPFARLPVDLPRFVAFCLSGWGAIYGVVNLIPMRLPGQLPSDGQVILWLLTRGRRWIADQVERSISSTLHQGRPLRDIAFSLEAIEALRATEPQLGRMHLYSALLALELGEVERADALLREATRAGAPTDPSLLGEFLFLDAAQSAVNLQDAARAAGLLERLDREMGDHPTQARIVDAALHALEGRPREAREAWDDFQRWLQTAESPNIRRGEHAWMLTRVQELVLAAEAKGGGRALPAARC